MALRATGSIQQDVGLVRVTVAPSPATLARVQALLGTEKRGKWAKALQAAVSRTVTTAEALMARRIARHVNMRIGDLKAVIESGRGSWDKPAGFIRLRKKRVPMIYYVTGGQRSAVIKAMRGGLWRKVRRAAGIKIRPRKIPSGKYQPTQTLRHSFYAVMKSGHFGIFRRKGKARTPIAEQLGPTPLGIFLAAAGEKERTVRIEVERGVAEALEKNVASQVSRFMGGGNG